MVLLPSRIDRAPTPHQAYGTAPHRAYGKET